MFIKIKKENRAFTLVETLVYVSLAVVIIGVLSMMFVQIFGLYKEITIIPKTDRSLLIAIDRMVKDIRTGENIILENSVFGSTSGELFIDSLENGSDVDKYYFLDGGRIVYQENGGSQNYLTSNDVFISKFQFEYLTSGISEGVRIEIDANIQKGGETVTKEYEGFAILRQSYE